MNIGHNGYKVYLVIKDYDTGLLLGINSKGEKFLTGDLLLAKRWANKKEARDYRDKNPMDNILLCFAKIKLSRSQKWD
mgnify:CR=1 FL=1